ELNKQERFFQVPLRHLERFIGSLDALLLAVTLIVPQEITGMYMLLERGQLKHRSVMTLHQLKYLYNMLVQLSLLTISNFNRGRLFYNSRYKSALKPELLTHPDSSTTNYIRGGYVSVTLDSFNATKADNSLK